MGKRKRNAEMEEELVELKKKLASQRSPAIEYVSTTKTNGHAATSIQSPPHPGDHMESQDVVGALMDMRRGIDGLRSSETRSRKLDNVFLTGDQVQELFDT